MLGRAVQLVEQGGARRARASAKGSNAVCPPGGPGLVSSAARGNIMLSITSEFLPGANSSDSRTSAGAPSGPCA
jgi:hypothetical protein